MTARPCQPPETGDQIRSADGCPVTVSLDAGSPLESVGGKAFQLARMRRMEIPVPPGFVITRGAFERFLDGNTLRAGIAAQLAPLDASQPASFERASAHIRGLICAAEFPAGIWERIRNARAEELPEGPLIVRSSAVGEDGSQASFAGQLDSLHPVNTDEELRRAVLQCWASYWSARSLFYQHTGRGRLDGMGVVVQRLVPAAVAGVMFTRGPVPGQMYGEYCHGHGEALVSGRLNPGRFTIGRDGLPGKIEAVPEQTANPGLDELLCDRITDLARHGLRMEADFGGAQDIEFAIAPGGDLFFVQSRAVTVAPTRDRPTRPDSGSRRPDPQGTRRVHWSNANVNENFPEPISPLLYSIASVGYYHYFRNLALGFGISRRRVRAVEGALRRIIGAHGARIYYNLTAIHEVLRCAPGGQRMVEYFDRFVGADDSPVTPPANEQTKRSETVCELTLVAIKSAWKYLFLTRRVGRLERAVSEFCELTTNEQLDRQGPDELLAALRGFLHIRFHEWNNAALADTAAMVCYGLLGNFLKRAFPESEAAGLHNSLLKGLPDLASGIPPLRLWELSRQIRAQPRLMELFREHPDGEVLGELRRDPTAAGLVTAIDDYLRAWGFRFSGELMLTVPALDEQTDTLVRWLRSYCEIEGESPAAVLQRQAAEREARLNELCGKLKRSRRHSRLPRLMQAPWLRLLLRGTQTSIRLREAARLKQAQLYNRCRRIALAIGDHLAGQGRLARTDDVFFLTWQELEDLLAGTAMFPHRLRELVALRRAEHVRLSAQQPPDDFTLAEGEYLPPDNGPTAASPETADGATGALTGLSACGGRAEGRAVVLRDLSGSAQLRAGDVLVTRQTDPGWGPVFFLIKGLILERGGMLSHGAIIAREYGIPAIVGVAHATERIATGQRVGVNGDTGHVELLD